MSETAMRIGLLHHTGGGNLGDESTQAAVIQSIRNRWPNASFVGFTMNPDDTTKRHGIPAYPIRRRTWRIGSGAIGEPPKGNIKTALRKLPTLFPIFRALYALIVELPLTVCQEAAFLVRSVRLVRSLNLLIVNGGGQLTGWGGPWEFTYTVFKWVLLAKLAGVRCYVLNIGVGPLRDPLSKLFSRWALSGADYVSFRDEESQQLARDIGFSGSSEVFPDSSYGLVIPDFRTASGDVSRRKPIVGVAPMPYCDPRVFAEKDQRTYDEYIAKLGRFTAHLIRNGYLVALLAGDAGIDPLAVDDLQKALKGEGVTACCQSLVVQSVDSCEELWRQMATLDYVVVCRFHAVVFAHLLNTPVIALSHHPKVASLMSDIGLSKYCVDIRSFEVEPLMETFQALVDDSADVKHRMADRLTQYSDQLTGQLDELFPLKAAS